MTEPLKDPVALEISEERVSRIWAQVSGHLGPESVSPRTSRRTKVLGGVLAAALMIGVIFTFSGGLRERNANGTIMDTRSDTLAMRLEEGSELELGPESKLVLSHVDEDNVTLELHRGTVTCEVPKKGGRMFQVRAGDFDVNVLGTRFLVEHDATDQGSRVFVRVLRGVVEVKRRGREGTGTRISAGQTWSSEEKLSAVDLNPALKNSGPGEEPSGGVRPSEVPIAPEETSASPEIAPAPALASNSREPVVSPRTAEQAFEAANALRRSSHPGEAARAYDKFIADFPGDPRAGLAAFEKARLEMDVLGRAKAARSALELSLRLSPRAGFREDVLARLVRVENILGQSGACRAAKERYLREYPRGVHREATLRACPPH